MKFKMIISLFILMPASFISFANDLNIKTRLFLDADHIGPFYQKEADDQTANKTHFELSSLKTTFKYDVSDKITSKLQLELTKEAKNDHDTDVEIKDALIAWTANPSIELSLGRYKEPMGHESLMGSSSLPAIERSMVTSAFAPGRNLGTQIAFVSAPFRLYSGIFKIEDDDIKDGFASTSRFVFSHTQHLPLNLDVIHIGAAYSYRDLNDSLIQIKERAEINSADNVVRSPRFYTKKQHISQLELGTRFDNFWLMSEYYQSKLNQTDGQSWLYQGFYIQLSAITNYQTHNAYKYKNGAFKQPKHQTHDLEWVIRYSGISLRDKEIGSEASSLMLGLNYFLKKDTSFMFNVLMPRISGNVVNTNQTGNGFSLRFRHEF
jgi:phosphate-selective porin OprO/OprP